MYFLFIDESGTPPKPEKAAGQYLIIGGLIVPEGSWKGISADFNRLLKKRKIGGEIKWKFFGSGNTQPANPFQGMTRDEINEIRTELFAIITSRKSIKLIACVTDIEAAYKMDSIVTQDDIYCLTYKGVTERFQYFLQDASRTTGQTQLGIVVSDHRMNSNDQSLRARHHQLLEERSSYTSDYENIVETIFFAPSHVSVGLQLADMTAGAIHRYFQYGDSQHVRVLVPSFRTSPTGQVDGYGIVKMPKQTFKDRLPSGERAN